MKSASSTVEAPVARRLREAFGGGKAAAKAPAAPLAKAAPRHRPPRQRRRSGGCACFGSSGCAGGS